MTRHLVARLVAAVVLTAATGVAHLAGSSPAAAATCPTSSGVSVVVDFGALGGGVTTSCDPAGASRNAAAMLVATGRALTYVQRQPGFICRVVGLPAEDPCVNTPPSDAYWGLFWSDGESGDWTYASTAAGSLRVPAGGYVGLAWQTGDRRVPGVAPAPRPAPTPTRTPTPQPSTKPSPERPSSPAPTQPASPSPTRAASPSATAPAAPQPSPSDTTRPRATRAPSTAPTSPAPSSAVPSPDGSPSPVPATTDDDPAAASAVPAWVVLVVLALLAAAGAVAVAVRRRGSPQ